MSGVCRVEGLERGWARDRGWERDEVYIRGMRVEIKMAPALLLLLEGRDEMR